MPQRQHDGLAQFAAGLLTTLGIVLLLDSLGVVDAGDLWYRVPEGPLSLLRWQEEPWFAGLVLLAGIAQWAQLSGQIHYPWLRAGIPWLVWAVAVNLAVHRLAGFAIPRNPPWWAATGYVWLAIILTVRRFGDLWHGRTRG